MDSNFFVATVKKHHQKLVEAHAAGEDALEEAARLYGPTAGELEILQQNLELLREAREKFKEENLPFILLEEDAPQDLVDSLVYISLAEGREAALSHLANSHWSE